MVKGATRAGDVNQALIELGSTVCKPRDPDCHGCPLQRWCRAYQISEKVTDLTEPASAAVLTSQSRARLGISKTSAPFVIRYPSRMVLMHHQ